MKKEVIIVLLVFIGLVFIGNNISGQLLDRGNLDDVTQSDSVGSGVIQVCTSEDLDNVRNNLGGSYIQICDIDLAGYNFNPIGDLSAAFAGDGLEGYVSVPFMEDMSSAFTGTYDGNGYKISNFNYNNPVKNQVGLFGFVHEGIIRNVNLENINVIGGLEVGGLVGNGLDILVENSYASGVVHGTDRFVGGLIGHMTGEVRNSHADVDASADGIYVGGLIGHLHVFSSIRDSFATGRVTGKARAVGGLIGSHHLSDMYDSYATGDVTGIGPDVEYVGGLVGYIQDGGSIHDSYATGKVDGAGEYVGGLAGRVERNLEQFSSIVNNSYATGDVTGNEQYTGGLAGWVNRGVITNSYATGLVRGNKYVGGLIGYAEDNSLIENSHATGTVFGSDDYLGGLIGFLNTGITIRDSYATGSLTGVLGDGSKYVGGLVGKAINGGHLIENSYAAGSTNAFFYAGGLVGEIADVGFVEDSIIKNSFATGSARATYIAGGLAGSLQGRSLRVEDCYATGFVFAHGTSGGLIGSVFSGNPSDPIVIKRCYSRGSVDAFTTNKGGLISDSSPFTVVEDSYWDTQTSGQADSEGGEGRRTVDMTSVPRPDDTYVDWDFENSWGQVDGNYPSLLWKRECGNSIIELGEECDDGNLIDGDGCNFICMIEFCNTDADTDCNSCVDETEINDYGEVWYSGEVETSDFIESIEVYFSCLV